MIFSLFKAILLSAALATLTACGGDSETQEEIQDTVAPTILLTGSNTIEILEGDDFTEPGASAQDNIDGDISNQIQIENPLDTSVAGTYTITYNVTDQAGNRANQVTRTVVVQNNPNAVPSRPENQAQAMRFLTQATFGGNLTDIEKLMSSGYETWLQTQFTQPFVSHFDLTLEIAEARERRGFPTENPELPNPENTWQLQADQESAWWQQAIFGEDQLRQRVAFALSELLVVSTAEPPLNSHAEAIAAYYDLLSGHAFGDFKELIRAVSTSPAMGIYLSHQGNERGDPNTGRTPDENYARELMQLFTIGLYELNLDGSAKRDSNGHLIPSYDQEDVGNLAKVMTGWSRSLRYTRGQFRSPLNSAGGYNHPMECIDSFHDFSAKQLLGESIPSGLSCEEDLDAALDIILNHPNVAPFISKHLIMRMVTSNPTPEYVGRVAAVFEDDGSQNRGNLQAVVEAMLMDPEARLDSAAANPEFGMLKNPVISTTNLLRAFKPMQPLGYARVVGEIMTPMRSPSVFNFYQPDHTPSNSQFQEKKMVSPEAQIYTELASINHQNHLYQIVTSRELREKVNRDEDNREPTDGLFNELSSTSGINEIHIDLQDQLRLMLEALTTETSIGFELINDDVLREKAILNLLDQLNLLLAQNQLRDDDIIELTDFLMQVRNNNDERRAIYIIQEAIQLILNLPYYAVQK